MISSFFKAVVCGFIPMLGFSQLADTYLIQPSIHLSYTNGDRWSYLTSIANRNSIEPNTKTLHIQATQHVNYDIGFYTRIGASVMYRESLDNSVRDEWRFSQRFIHARNYNAVKVAHRLQWDQRIRQHNITHRWRYQLSGSLPLNGEQLNTGELYINAAAESLLSTQKNNKPSYDQRVSIAIGVQLLPQLKLQLSHEYRIENYTNNYTSLLFSNISMYYKL